MVLFASNDGYNFLSVVLLVLSSFVINFFCYNLCCYDLVLFLMMVVFLLCFL